MVAKGLPCLQIFTRIPEIECYQCKAYIFETQKRNQYIHFKCFQPIYISCEYSKVPSIGLLRFCKRLHEFQKSSGATVKLISLKTQKRNRYIRFKCFQLKHM